MAPEPEILKRKRSRPSDWWAAAPTTPQQEDESPVKKRAGPSNADAEGKGIKDAPAAGNRGKSVKGKEVTRDGENAEEDEMQEMPVRRGRRSGGREESLGGIGTSQSTGRAERKKANSAQEGGEDQSAPKKRGRPAAVQVEVQPEAVAEKVAPKKRGRPSVGRVEEPAGAAEALKPSKSLRRGRASNTEAEARAVTESAVQTQDVSKKRGRRPALEKEAEIAVEEADEDPIIPQKRRRPAKSTEVESPVDELIDENPSRQTKKRRRSGAEILEAEALALTTTEDYAKGRTRLPIVDQGEVIPGRNGVERDRKRLRRSDAQIAEPKPTAPTQIEEEERGRPRARRSDADLQEAPMAGPSKKSERSRQRDQNVDVEAASSKLQSNRSGPKKGVKPIVEKRTKSGRGSATAEQSQKSKKRMRSSIPRPVANAVPEPPQAKKKSSKRQSQEEPKSRERKNGEKLPENEPVKRRRIEKPPQATREDEDPPEVEEALVYQHLQAFTRRVSRQTIDAKWEPLPPGCVERISQILQDLQRPVVVRYSDERKRDQSSTALQMISRKLVSKVSKGLPFPQGTRNHREDDFDFEKILDHNRALEAQLTPALHANELLEAQVSKEMALLETEREALAKLQANAKTEASLRIETARKLHSLLQPRDGTIEIEVLKDDIGLGIGQIPRPLDVNIQNDEHVQALVKELHGHVASIQGNIRQVQGVTQAISKSKAAVQATLFDHLDSVQYEDVVLGAK